MKKKTPLIVTSLAALACVFSLNAFAAMPSGSHQWKGDVDFWVSKVGTATKRNDKNTTAYSFTGAPTENIRIYLTEKKSNAGAAVVSSKTLVKFGEEKLNQRTSALNGDVIDITAAREYILDTKVQLYGQWLP